MADPNLTNVGYGRTVFVEDSKVNQSDVVTPFTTQNFLTLSSKAGTGINIILGTGDPSGADYSAHPIGSLYISQTDGGVFKKTAAGDSWTEI